MEDLGLNGFSIERKRPISKPTFTNSLHKTKACKMYYLAMGSFSHSNESMSKRALLCTSCAGLFQQLEQIAVGEDNGNLLFLEKYVYVFISIYNIYYICYY